MSGIFTKAISDIYNLKLCPPPPSIMATKKDMRRADLSKSMRHPMPPMLLIPFAVIPYQIPAPKEGASDISGTLGSTLPMAAMFTRNKFMGWCDWVRDERSTEI